MSNPNENKFRAAAQILQRGRDLLVDALADDVIDQGEDLVDNPYQFNEFLETQGTRLHFLMLVLGQLEQSAESHDEYLAAEEPPPLPLPPQVTVEPPKKRRPRTKKVVQEASTEGQPDEVL